MLTAVTSILIFSMVILIHELGHFLAARSVGICVSEFSIGMGPVLFSKKGKETTYFIKALPIGGYIKMEGEDEEETSASESSFNSKSPIQRFKVIVMGPVMNFLLATALFMIIVLVYGISTTTVKDIDYNGTEYQAGLQVGDKIQSVQGKTVRYWEDLTNEITKHENKYEITVLRNGNDVTFEIPHNYRHIVGISPVVKEGEYTTEMSVVNIGFPAEIAGIKAGDIINTIDGVEMTSWDLIRETISESEGRPLIFGIYRDGLDLEISVTPEKQITIGYVTEVDRSFTTAITGSIHRTIYYVKLMFQLIGMIVTGQVGSEAIAGPVGIISMVGEAARIGLYPLLNLAAFISINLGFFNLLPIPALDGSRLAFIAIEGIRGKRIPPEKEGYVHFIGFVLLMALMLFVIYNDVLKILN